MGETSRWVVVAFDFGNTDKHDAVLVTAETEQEAAEVGAELLQRTWDDTDGLSDLTIEHVFVGPWPRTAYTVTRQFVADVSEWQCCGGPNESGGHYGGCPTQREEAADA